VHLAEILISTTGVDDAVARCGRVAGATRFVLRPTGRVSCVVGWPFRRLPGSTLSLSLTFFASSCYGVLR